MSFPEAVKQVLFRGVVSSGLGCGHVPRSRRTGACAKRVRLFSHLVFCFFLFFCPLLLGSLEAWRSVSVSPFCPVDCSLICSGELAIGALLICHLVWALSGDGGGGYTVEEAIGFPVGIGRRAGRRFELERGGKT